MLAAMKASSSVLPVLLLSTGLAACAKSVPEAQSAPGLVVDRAPPPPGARVLRELKAVDGHGCGIFGTLGTYEGAVALLGEQARALGAEYVRITDVKEPAATHSCVEKAYTVLGVAYDVPPAPAAAAPTSATPVPPVVLANSGTNALPTRGLPLGAAGCSFGTLAPGATRALSFSARVPRGKPLAVWIDHASPTPTAEGIALEYDPAARRVSLVRRPGNVAVTVGPEPFDLDDAWHEWRLLRAPDRISVWLDDKLLLLHAAPAPSADGGFHVDGEGVEVRDVGAASP